MSKMSELYSACEGDSEKAYWPLKDALNHYIGKRSFVTNFLFEKKIVKTYKEAEEFTDVLCTFFE